MAAQVRIKLQDSMRGFKVCNFDFSPNRVLLAPEADEAGAGRDRLRGQARPRKQWGMDSLEVSGGPRPPDNLSVESEKDHCPGHPKQVQNAEGGLRGAT